MRFSVIALIKSLGSAHLLRPQRVGGDSDYVFTFYERLRMIKNKCYNDIINLIKKTYRLKKRSIDSKAQKKTNKITKFMSNNFCKCQRHAFFNR